MKSLDLDITSAVQRHLDHRPKPDLGGLRHEQGIGRLVALAGAAGITIVWGGTASAYEPATDTVFMPRGAFYLARHPWRPKQHQKIDLAHELLHASGARHRQRRPQITERGDAYAREELLSETGAAMLLVDLDLSRRVTVGNATYLQSWLQALPNAAVELEVGIARAAQAVAFLLGYARAGRVSVVA